jgi:hypothetical protein
VKGVKFGVNTVFWPKRQPPQSPKGEVGSMFHLMAFFVFKNNFVTLIIKVQEVP